MCTEREWGASEAAQGCLLGVAVGDALGLPYEGLTPTRGRRLLGRPTRYRLLFGRGMVSDDTEHSVFVARALALSGGDEGAFRRALSWSLRWWLLSLPAGVGWATLRALFRLWLGVRESGVFSAGNGPAMRSALLGAVVEDVAQLRVLVGASTRLTHTDPKAWRGAMAVALGARSARDARARGVEVTCAGYLEALREGLSGDEGAGEVIELAESAAASVERGEETWRFARSLCGARGVTGYVYDSVPVALHAWLSHPRAMTEALQAAIECGGDTDTVASMVGGMVGAGVGVEGIEGWLRGGLWEPTMSAEWLTMRAREAARGGTEGSPVRAERRRPLRALLRSAVFMLVVVAHVVRRALPPYGG